MAAYTPDQQLNWIRRYTSIRMSELSEARANYFFFGIIIKEEFPKALWQALKSDFMWDNTPCDEWDLDDLFFRATSNLSLSVTSTQLQVLRNKYRQLARAKMDPKTFNRFLDRARDAFTTLGVSTDSLDASKKFSVVNEFSAVGLQSLIKQPGQGSSDSNIWIKGRYLGAGSYGKVYTLTHYPTEIMVAMKIVEMQAHCTETTKEVKQLQNEVEILSKLRHERIVSCHGSEQKGNHFYLFMDFMAEGSLYDYIKRKGNLDENLCRKCTRQILEGVDFLHSKEIIHRDIKGANVLLDRDGNVKLADFGISRKIEKIGSKTNLKSDVGTVHWMAPEILQGEVYGRKVDIWSIGCTVVEMLTGYPPLGHLEWPAAIYHIGKGPPKPKLPEGVSLDAIDFVQVALTFLPAERPWCEELLRHAFIQPIVSDHWEGDEEARRRLSENDDSLIEKDPAEERGDEEATYRRRSVRLLRRKLSEGDLYPPIEKDPTEEREPIEIIKHPKSQTVKEGSQVVLECKVESSCSRLLYQWFKDDGSVLPQKEASLVLKSVELRDFGNYTCHVSYDDGFGEGENSFPAFLDVIPQRLNGMRPKLLRELDINTKDEVASLLENKRFRLREGWRQVADVYGMKDDMINALYNSKFPGRDVLDFLMASKPDLKVYDLCKVLKDGKIERFDIVKKLEDHFLIRGETGFGCSGLFPVYYEPIKIIKHPTSQTVKEGSQVVLKCKVKEKCSGLLYQWFKDNGSLLRQKEASLVLKSVELRDFGNYTCHVSYDDDGFGEGEISFPAFLNVIPQRLNGMRLKLLRELDFETCDEVASLLEDKRFTMGGFRQVAAIYGMEDRYIDTLNNLLEPGRDVLEYLKASKPNLTVYDFCRVLKDCEIERFDIVKNLEDHFLIREETEYV